MVANPVVFLLIGAEAEGSAIPEAVPVGGLVPETQGAAGGTPEPMEVADGEAPRWPKENATTYCQNRLWK
jgi:hypothetical protein